MLKPANLSLRNPEFGTFFHKNPLEGDNYKEEIG
jgi:hypothetical protein